MPTTAIAYPAGLPPPQAPLRLVPRERRAATAIEGRLTARNRQRDFAGARYEAVSWLYSPAEMATWRAWYEGTLLHGQCWFAASLPLDGGFATRVVRYVGEQQRSHVGRGIFRVSSALEIRGASALPSITPFDACTLFFAGDRGYCLNFTNPATMRNSTGAQAAVGQSVHTALVEGGTFPTFDAGGAGPVAGAGYLQTALGGLPLQATGLMNYASQGGMTVAVVATEPDGYDVSGSLTATVIDNQAGGATSTSRGPEFTSGGVRAYTFNSAGTPLFIAAGYTPVAAARNVFVLRNSGGTASLYRNGALVVSGAGSLNNTNSRHTVAASQAGTNNPDYFKYSGRISHVFAIDRAISDDELAQYHAWALAL